jgi:hypothetical protein
MFSLVVMSPKYLNAIWNYDNVIHMHLHENEFSFKDMRFVETCGVVIEFVKVVLNNPQMVKLRK